MERSRSRVRLPCLTIAVAASLAATAASADSWERTRRTVIEPINTALQRHLPRAIEARNLDRILDLHAAKTGTGSCSIPRSGFSPIGKSGCIDGDRTPGPSRSASVTKGCSVIERAELRIHRVRWSDGDRTGVPAEVRLQVRGRRR